MDVMNKYTTPRTTEALSLASDPDGAREVCELCGKLEEELGLLRERFDALAKGHASLYADSLESMAEEAGNTLPPGFSLEVRISEGSVELNLLDNEAEEAYPVELAGAGSLPDGFRLGIKQAHAKAAAWEAEEKAATEAEERAWDKAHGKEDRP